MKNIAGWLGVDIGFYNRFDFDVKNKSHHYKNRIIHKLAVSVNNTGQRFWRTNPAFKKVILNTYYKINGSPVNKKDSDKETIEFLRNYFHSHNDRLHDLLIRNGYSGLPKWMEPVKQTA
jgi:hypothetical protein